VAVGKKRKIVVKVAGDEGDEIKSCSLHFHAKGGDIHLSDRVSGQVHLDPRIHAGKRSDSPPLTD
jgi:hypothetical protein